MEYDMKAKITLWTNEVFKNKNYNKTKIYFPDYDTKGGYAGDVVFIDIIGEKNGNQEKHELIIKKNRETNLEALENMGMCLVYMQEVKIYSMFIPLINKFAKDRNATPFTNIPYCYGTINRKNEYGIVLENLKSKGFKLHTLEKTLDMIHTKIILEAYANFHAFSFAFRDQKYTDIFEDFEKTNKEMVESKLFDLFIKTIEKELDYVINMYKKKNRLNFIEKLENLKKNFSNIYRNDVFGKDEKYLVIRHGDCWNNNFLFHYEAEDSEPDKVAIIDWQFVAAGSPLVEVFHFLFNCCCSSELQHLDDLLEFYYHKLSMKLLELGSNPEKCFPKKDFQNSINKYAPYGISTMPLAAKLSNKCENGETYDLSRALEEDNFCAMFNTGLKDSEKYFNRIDGILKICIERGYI